MNIAIFVKDPENKMMASIELSSFFSKKEIQTYIKGQRTKDKLVFNENEMSKHKNKRN